MSLNKNKRLKMDSKESKTWIKNEIEGCDFVDERLHKRFYKFLENSATGIGGSIPYVSQD
ncbi:transposase [Leptospira santarosai]|uniref:transposase n=1 Tax=Leptospira santarosai TaxID=28183 RepID=UPI001E6386E1|nr:transposase [Leptospira santarosai]